MIIIIHTFLYHHKVLTSVDELMNVMNVLLYISVI